MVGVVPAAVLVAFLFRRVSEYVWPSEYCSDLIFEMVTTYLYLLTGVAALVIRLFEASYFYKVTVGEKSP